MLKRLLTCSIMTALVLVAACSKDESPTEPENGPPPVLALGFTDFPHARTNEAYLAAWDVIENDGNMAVLHFDDGVPWPEALQNIRYAPEYENELSSKESLVPIGHVVYLAVTPISFTRDSLAAYRGTEPNQPLPPPWDTLSFDDDDVINAFTNHCRNMIDHFTPDYFAYAIEANMLITLAPEKWDEFVVLAGIVYERIKALHPNLPVFITLHTEFFHADPVAQLAGIEQVLPYTDMIALSSYAYGQYPDPADLPVDHFSALHDLAPEKGFAIAETAWPAEDVTAPYPVFIPATDTTQLAYIDRLLYDADSLDAAFVSYFFSRDFDEFWEAELQYSDTADLIRFWKDTGLYDGEGNPRPALESWRAYLEPPATE
ncbi:MAG TPA: hypothetical protein VMX58_07205 [Patescibacteria group bacterium]|nr:hypothetical protein [Patescibacteria group bacterium]